MNEHDKIALEVDLPEHGLRKGDVGAIVFSTSDSPCYEVEFVAADGATMALLTLSADQIRPIEPAEIIPHRRAGVA